MKRNLFILLSVACSSMYGAQSATSQLRSQLDRELSALEKEDNTAWIAGRAALLEQINGLVRQGFEKQAIPFFRRISKRDDLILQEKLQELKTQAEWNQLKRDKKSLKSISERQALTIKNLEAENKKKYDALDLAEKKIESLNKENVQLKTDNERLTRELQEAQIALAEKSMPV